jgi:hypothetical protein
LKDITKGLKQIPMTDYKQSIFHTDDGISLAKIFKEKKIARNTKSIMDALQRREIDYSKDNNVLSFRYKDVSYHVGLVAKKYHTGDYNWKPFKIMEVFDGKADSQ